ENILLPVKTIVNITLAALEPFQGLGKEVSCAVNTIRAVFDQLRSADADFRMGISSIHEGLEPSPVRLSVVVEENDIIPGAMPQSLDIPTCETPILRQRNQVKRSCLPPIPQASGNRQGAIRGGVVNKDNFEIPEALSLNSPETILEDPLAVVIDDDNAYFRHGIAIYPYSLT